MTDTCLHVCSALVEPARSNQVMHDQHQQAIEEKRWKLL